MSLRNAKDFWAGILFAVTGVLAIVTVQEHSLGSAARMGPAYFPTLLGGLLTVLGVILSLRGLFSREALVEPDGGRVEPFHWKIFFLVLGSVLAFSLLLASCGLMIAIAAMVMISALADKNFRLKETLIVIVVLDVIAWVIFVYGVGMLIPVWPAFL